VWVDHALGVIHEAIYAEERRLIEVRRLDIGHHVAAAIPRAAGGLIVAGGLAVSRLDEAGNDSPFAKIDEDPRLIRINEAKCDSQGRLWVGTLSWEFKPRAALYRIAFDGSVSRVLDGVSLANGFDWSPDGARFYFIDTLAASIDVFDFDVATGSIGNRRSVVQIERGAGGANGMTVDREGCLWVALTGGGEVRRYTNSGELLQRVTLPIPGPTSCAFAGPDCADLIITSRSGRMPEIALTIGVRPEMMEGKGPEAGALYLCRPGVQGNPAHTFQG
jgi:sugar lactone lactonase YvrE